MFKIVSNIVKREVGKRQVTTVVRNRVLVGIMAARQNNAEGIFAERGFFRGLMAAGRLYGLTVFAFSPADVDWTQGKVLGWVYSPSVGRLVSSYYPLPNIIYDRMFPTGSAYGLMASRGAHRLRRHPRVQLFSSALNGKWQVYKALSQYEKVMPFLPETRLCATWESVGEMLAAHNVVYLKPDMGSQGKGIMRIQNLGNNRYAFKTKDRRSRLNYGTVWGKEALQRLARNFINGRRYLIQQGLSLNIYKNCPCDVRVVAQKNGQGNWTITGHAVRIGPRVGVTSNLHGGGTALRLPYLLRQLYPSNVDEQERIIQNIEQLSLDLCHSLDDSLGTFAELGLDIGLEASGDIWLIEVNSKPGRKVFLHTKDRLARRQSILNPIAYCKYLSTQQRKVPIAEGTQLSSSEDEATAR